MNKKSQATIFMGFMIMMAIIVLTFGMSPAIKSFVDDARTDMDCSNASISDFDKVTCITIDMGTFYFIAGMIVIGIAVFASRKFK